jgi:adenosylcobinamide-GDP ribazoletransferase
MSELPLRSNGAILSEEERRQKRKSAPSRRVFCGMVAAMASFDDRPLRRRFLDGLAAAAALLTRLPLPAAAASGEPLSETVWAFPLVGAAIGAACGLLFALARALHLGALPAALLALLLGVLLTGAMHEDGLADTADGFGGGRDREEKLAIMRDSRHGTFAVAAILFSLGLRAAALAAIAAPLRALLALVAAHAAARALLPIAALFSSPAREEGLGAAFGEPPLPATLLSAALALALALLTLGPLSGLLALALAALSSLAVVSLAHRQIGGYTGDVLGAIEQVGEVAMLLVAAAR